MRADTVAGKARREDSGSLGKVLALLRCFVDRQEQWGVKELSVALSLPPSTVHRYLKILCREGYLVFDKEIQKYKVGMELFRVASVLSRRIKIREIARRFMRDVVDKADESCWLALHDVETNSVVYVDEVEGSQPFRYYAPIGKREPLTDGAAGIAILAFLNPQQRGEYIKTDHDLDDQLYETRSRGCAIARQPASAPGSMLAAPIFDAHDKPIGCLGMAISELRPSKVDVAAAAALLTRTTHQLSQSLGSQLLGGGATGTWRLGIGVIADLVNDRMPELRMTTSWGAGNRNLADLQHGSAGYCMAVAGSLDTAFQGKRPFTRPHTRLRGMFSLFPLHLHVAARKGIGIADGIRSLQGRRISSAEEGFTTEFVFDRLFRIASGHNERRPAANFTHLDYAEANRQLRHGLVDAVVSLTGVPNPPYVELAQDPGIELVDIEEDVLETFLSEEPSYSRAVIGAGTYPGQTTDVRTLMVPTVMCTIADRPDDEVYEITRTVYENRSQLVLAAPAYQHFSKEFARCGWTAPMHPGAERFWRSLDGN